MATKKEVDTLSDIPFQETGEWDDKELEQALNKESEGSGQLSEAQTLILDLNQANVNFTPEDISVDDLQFSVMEKIEQTAEHQKSVEEVELAPSLEVSLEQTKEPESVLMTSQDIVDDEGASEIVSDSISFSSQNLDSEETEQIQKKINHLEEALSAKKVELVALRKEWEERKMEVAVLRKRHVADLNEMGLKIKRLEDHNALLLERESKYKTELQKLGYKVRDDLHKVQQREKTLENQLELLQVDARTQVENRDKKILELKRKLDNLEFEMESAALQEKKEREKREEIEGKLDRTLETLRQLIDEVEMNEMPLKVVGDE